MDGRATALPVDSPGFLFVQRRQSSTVHPVQSDAMDEAEKENVGLHIDTFRVFSQASAKDVARPEAATGPGDGERGASIGTRGAPQRAGTATTPLEPVTMPSMNPSSAPFLTLGGIRLRRKPRPVRVSSFSRGVGSGHTEPNKASTAPEASRSRQLQQERLERQQRAGWAKASRRKGPHPSSIPTHTCSASLDMQNDMLDCVVSDRHSKGAHQA